MGHTPFGSSWEPRLRSVTHFPHGLLLMIWSLAHDSGSTPSPGSLARPLSASMLSTIGLASFLYPPGVEVPLSVPGALVPVALPDRIPRRSHASPCHPPLSVFPHIKFPFHNSSLWGRRGTGRPRGSPSCARHVPPCSFVPAGTFPRDLLPRPASPRVRGSLFRLPPRPKLLQREPDERRAGSPAIRPMRFGVAPDPPPLVFSQRNIQRGHGGLLCVRERDFPPSYHYFSTNDALRQPFLRR